MEILAGPCLTKHLNIASRRLNSPAQGEKVWVDLRSSSDTFRKPVDYRPSDRTSFILNWSSIDGGDEMFFIDIRSKPLLDLDINLLYRSTGLDSGANHLSYNRTNANQQLVRHALLSSNNWSTGSTDSSNRVFFNKCLEICSISRNIHTTQLVQLIHQIDPRRSPLDLSTIHFITNAFVVNWSTVWWVVLVKTTPPLVINWSSSPGRPALSSCTPLTPQLVRPPVDGTASLVQHPLPAQLVRPYRQKTRCSLSNHPSKPMRRGMSGSMGRVVVCVKQIEAKVRAYTQ